MPQLVGYHRLDFLLGKLVQQGIGQQHPLGPPQSGKSGVGLLCRLAQVETINPRYVQAHRPAETLNTCLQGMVVRQGLELVEQGENEDRSQPPQHHGEQEHH
ncbi:hypothetical protein ES703_17898 [subsurface metagenome]